MTNQPRRIDLRPYGRALAEVELTANGRGQYTLTPLVDDRLRTKHTLNNDESARILLPVPITVPEEIEEVSVQLIQGAGEAAKVTQNRMARSFNRAQPHSAR